MAKGFCVMCLVSWKQDARLKAQDLALAPTQNMSDGEERKLGERTGLDTPVVPAVNDADCGGTLS